MEYSLEETRQIVGLSPSTIRRLIEGGFVCPARGNRRQYRFDFRDLIVLRMAKALADARLSPRRISASLKRLREKLPDGPSFTRLRIAAVGNDVVVSDGAQRWRADDGQYLLAFEVFETRGIIGFAQAEPARAAHEDWFGRGLRLEETDVAEATMAYARAVKEEICLPGAYANWGRLLHEAGRLEEAEAVYRQGTQACPRDALLLFNFAVLKEDQGLPDDAIALYKRALTHDAGLCDAHYNLGLLYQARRQTREAVRHFNAYRKLSAAADSEG